jgi:1-aminocyclopropane-1-carboxylate deaminase
MRDYLLQWVKQYIQTLPHSRVHPLQTFGENCFVKRDDELSFGVSGSKLRKYASLLCFLKKNGVKEVILSGNPFSNHILSLTQLLIENEIKPTLFLLKNRETVSLKGNFLLLSLFVEENQIHWVHESEWPHLDQCLEDYAREIPHSFIVPPGAFMGEALPGALTLALDILENERILGTEFSDIFIEAGTGLSAISLILGLAALQKTTKVHVLLLADDPLEFAKKMEEFRHIFNKLTNLNLSELQVQDQFEIHSPSQALSFGSTNSSIFKEVRDIAREEGFLTDPIYSAKLFFESRKILKDQRQDGPTLLIHSGGGLTLMGFETQLQKTLLQAK